MHYLSPGHDARSHRLSSSAAGALLVVAVAAAGVV